MIESVENPIDEGCNGLCRPGGGQQDMIKKCRSLQRLPEASRGLPERPCRPLGCPDVLKALQGSGPAQS